jgi:hypothetical protein
MARSPVKLFSFTYQRRRIGFEPLESRHLLSGFQTVEAPSAELQQEPALEIDVAGLTAIYAMSDDSDELSDNPSYAVVIDEIVTGRIDFSHGDLSSVVQDEGRSASLGPDQAIAPLRKFVVGSLDDQRSTAVHVMLVETSQLVRFTLAASSEEVVATLQDAEGRVLLQLFGDSADPETRLLAAGEYRIHLSGGSVESATYILEAVAVGQYLGPELVDPSASPITPCVDGPGEFCYPDGSYSWNSYIWVDEQLEPSPASSDASSLWYDDWWYWYVDLMSDA